MEASTDVVMIREGDIQSGGGTALEQTCSPVENTFGSSVSGRPERAGGLAGRTGQRSPGPGVRVLEVP